MSSDKRSINLLALANEVPNKELAKMQFLPVGKEERVLGTFSREFQRLYYVFLTFCEEYEFRLKEGIALSIQHSVDHAIFGPYFISGICDLLNSQLEDILRQSEILLNQIMDIQAALDACLNLEVPERRGISIDDLGFRQGRKVVVVAPEKREPKAASVLVAIITHRKKSGKAAESFEGFGLGNEIFHDFPVLI